MSGSRKSPPRHVAIAAMLKDRIVRDGLGPHTLMPSERELGEQYGVSRMTARQALMLLESEGAVYREPPRGTFVAEPRFQFRIGSFTAEINRLGKHADAALLWSELQQPDPPTAEALGLSSERVHTFQRLRLADGVPIALETTSFPADLTPGILDQPSEGSLWAILQDRYSLKLVRSTAVIESMVLDEATSDLLSVRAGASGISLTRRTFDAADRCVEFARDVYRADRTSFQVTETIHPDCVPSALATEPPDVAHRGRGG
jgi:GntR family transcriptional regulator